MNASDTLDFTVPARPRAIGIDFSAAASAHTAIWICTARRTGAHELRVHNLARADALMDVRKGRERDDAHDAVRAVVTAARDAVVGLDAPFSLPDAALEPGVPWTDFVAGFEAAYRTPDVFRNAMQRKFDSKEPRRDCDVAAKTPWCAWNLRLYRQTWFAIARVIAPLLREGNACCPPMQAAVPGVPALVEACPAAALKARGLYKTGYKGPSGAAVSARATMISELEAGGLSIDVESARAAILDAGGDALDAVVAAVAVAQAAGRTLKIPAVARREAWVVV